MQNFIKETLTGYDRSLFFRGLSQLKRLPTIIYWPVVVPYAILGLVVILFAGLLLIIGGLLQETAADICGLFDADMRSDSFPPIEKD